MLRMADVELTSVDWLWFPYIPFGKLTIIQGNPGEGKTYFAMRLAAASTNRKPLPGMRHLSLSTSSIRPPRTVWLIPSSPD
ncbi:AAA family ATPase [Treponema pectinovorum]